MRLAQQFGIYLVLFDETEMPENSIVKYFIAIKFVYAFILFVQFILNCESSFISQKASFTWK